MLLLIATLTTSTASIHTITSFAIAITRILFATITDIGFAAITIIITSSIPFPYITIVTNITVVFYCSSCYSYCYY